jgi:hypothetical protein
LIKNRQNKTMFPLVSIERMSAKHQSKQVSPTHLKPGAVTSPDPNSGAPNAPAGINPTVLL